MMLSTPMVLLHKAPPPNGDIKMVLYIALLIVLLCVIVIVNNSLQEYRRTVYLNKNMTGLLLMSIIAPIFNDYANESIEKMKKDNSISDTELNNLVNKIYNNIQILTTLNEEQKKVLTKDTIRILIKPYYEQLVSQIISIEKYYSQKSKKNKEKEE